jgi:hypothetical protein
MEMKNSHFVGAEICQYSFSQQYLGAIRTPSPAQQNNHVVNNLDAEKDETFNIDKDSRTDKHLNRLVRHTIGRFKPCYIHVYLKINNCLLLICFYFVVYTIVWLPNSKDLIDGNGRKAYAYWADVIGKYNKTT